MQLVELFLGEEPPQFVVEALIKFITEGYVETEQEKFLRLQKVWKTEVVILFSHSCNLARYPRMMHACSDS